MYVVEFKKFEKFGELPRSSDKLAKDISQVSGDTRIIFISHRWLRPWHTQQECEREGHKWAGMAHPDDDAGSKHKLLCAAVHQLAEEKDWNIQDVCLWLDFCSVEQDNLYLLRAGVASLRGYISVCDAVLIPSPEVPAEHDQRTVDKIAGDYGQRAWTLLESMAFYTVRHVIT
jgi:hypothetical protein